MTLRSIYISKSVTDSDIKLNVSIRFDNLFKHAMFPHSLFNLVHLLQCPINSEELLGKHETIQICCKFNLEVSLRLLHTNNLRHLMARDVSQLKLLLCFHLQYRSFTKRGGLSLKAALTNTSAWP